MNKDKKIIIGLVIIIIVLLVGGLAFYIGKNSREETKIPVAENNLPQTNQNNVTVPSVQNTQVNNVVNNKKDCLPTTVPWLKVLSPNGGEFYSVSQPFTVKWISCNVPASPNDVIVALHQNGDWQNVTYLSNGTLNDGNQTFTVPTVELGNYKIRVGYSSATVKQDFSNNYFTINASGTCRTIENCGAGAASCTNGLCSQYDKHGCVPDGGYTWCEAKQKCLQGNC